MSRIFTKQKIKILTLATIFLFAGTNVFAESSGYCAHTSPGTHQDTISMADKVFGSKIHLPTRAEIENLSALFLFTGNAEVKAGIYDNAYNLVAETLPYINISGYVPADWYDLTFADDLTLKAGDYWLVITANNANVKYWVARETTDGSYYKDSVYNGLPASFSDRVYFEERAGSICANYDALSGTYMTIDTPDITSLMAHVGTLVSDLGIVSWFAIGLPLGFWVIKKTLSLFRKR